MELKAIVTTYEIQEDGELIYDSTTNDNQTLKVTLDRALLNDIKAANSLAEATGGYASSVNLLLVMGMLIMFGIILSFMIK